MCAAQKCFVIAATNGLEIDKLYKDPTNEKKIALKKKIGETLNFAEKIKEKINSAPEYDAKKVFVMQYQTKEVQIISSSSTIRDKYYEIWEPGTGITNIFANEVFADPNGLLPLSVR